MLAAYLLDDIARQGIEADAERRCRAERPQQHGIADRARRPDRLRRGRAIGQRSIGQSNGGQENIRELSWCSIAACMTAEEFERVDIARAGDEDWGA